MVDVGNSRRPNLCGVRNLLLIQRPAFGSRFGLRNPPKTSEHLELELAPENYRLKLSSLPKVCPDKNFKFRVTGHRHPLELAT